MFDWLANSLNFNHGISFLIHSSPPVIEANLKFFGVNIYLVLYVLEKKLSWFIVIVIVLFSYCFVSFPFVSYCFVICIYLYFIYRIDEHIESMINFRIVQQVFSSWYIYTQRHAGVSAGIYFYLFCIFFFSSFFIFFIFSYFFILFSLWLFVRKKDSFSTEIDRTNSR